MRPTHRALPILLAVFSVSCETTRSEQRPEPASTAPRIVVRLAPGAASAPLDGRVLLVLATKPTPEPREQVDGSNESAQLFGVDVEAFKAGDAVTFGPEVLGYPTESLSKLPAGDYWIQAVLHRYETFHRADGHTLKLPMDRGEGQHWNEAPGNPASTPAKIHWDPASGGEIAVVLDHPLPPLPPTPDTRYVKHIKIRSEKLSRFWGRDMEIGAVVLLPEGWDSHPKAHYPLFINHSHFDREIFGWRESPPEANLPPVDRAGLLRDCPNGHGTHCDEHGYKRFTQESGYRFFQQWTGPGFPRVILVEIQHANPYYDDSYAVNSANVGPYGDAIVEELLPEIERRFRGLGPWARGMYGGSTGGWEAIAAQIFYPDQFNGAVANCPDPIDFRAYETADLYGEKNAFFSEGPFRRTPRASRRNALGQPDTTIEQDNRMELVLGEHSRSGEQFDIWEAVYSPAGTDGYPRRIFDKRTGAIDPEVAAYWREHYDLSHILQRDWATLGPKLQGKLHVNVGNLDTYFLDGAVKLAQDRIQTLQNPTPDIAFAYGARDGHCWSGDREHPNYESRLTYHARFIPMLVEHFLRTAPPGADVTSWRY